MALVVDDCFVFRAPGKEPDMNTLLIIAGVIAIILLLVGGFNSALNFLLWVGIILLVLAAIGWVMGRARGGVR